MRACQPAVEGTVHRDDVEIHYERYGQGAPTVLLLPTWSLVHSRHWKMQVAYLARHFTVLCFDGRGNGRSDRPIHPDAYTDVVFASDALAVMDAAGIESAVVVTVSCGTLWGLRLCAEHPERVLGAVFIAPTAPLVPGLPERRVQRFHKVFDEPVGWQKYNARFWRTNYPDFVDFFMRQIFTEPHSTKPIEDAIGWALETDGQTLIASDLGLKDCDGGTTRRLATQVACPVLLIHGTHDAVRGYAEGQALAECTSGRLATFEGSGHFPHVRDPVRVNLLIRQFADRVGR
jgi:pimeloyl-ACP methyl ester carboxylesterase